MYYTYLCILDTYYQAVMHEMFYNKDTELSELI